MVRQNHGIRYDGNPMLHTIRGCFDNWLVPRRTELELRICNSDGRVRRCHHSDHSRFHCVPKKYRRIMRGH